MSELPGLSPAQVNLVTGTAQRFLAAAFDSVETMLQWQASAVQMAADLTQEALEEDRDLATRTEEVAQDMLRATIVFAGAGLDSAVKQLIRDALPALLTVNTQAEE